MTSRANPATTTIQTSKQPIVIVMGVAGSGKTTLARALAAKQGWRFLEGDDFHSEENIRLLTSGVALTDEQRAPWLNAIANWIAQCEATGEGAAVSCSALKRRYRDVLRAGRRDVHFVMLDGATERIAQRLHQRQGHFMSVQLLQSQLNTLERPAPDENVLVLPIELAVDEACKHVLAWLEQ